MNCASAGSRGAAGEPGAAVEGAGKSCAGRNEAPGSAPRVCVTRSNAMAHRERLRSREFVHELLRRCEPLPEDDVALIRAIYVDELPVARMAALMGVSTRSVRRRVDRMVARVMSPDFAFVVEHSWRWGGTRRGVAHAIIVLGRSLRQTAEDLDLSLHGVRHHHAAILALCHAAGLLSSKAGEAGLDMQAHAGGEGLLGRTGPAHA